jgi:hypothetical protein
VTSPITARTRPGSAPAGRALHGDATVPEALGIVSRLAVEFPDVDRQTVDRQVRDTWNCAVHLDADVTPEAVEELAREHLIALDGSLELIRPAPVRGRRRPAARRRS